MVYSTPIIQAINLLHDLGHAADLSGLNTMIFPDSSSPDGMAMSVLNGQMVANNCFPTGD